MTDADQARPNPTRTATRTLLNLGNLPPKRSGFGDLGVSTTADILTTRPLVTTEMAELTCKVSSDYIPPNPLSVIPEDPFPRRPQQPTLARIPRIP